ncbi:MAG: hypothetical protein NZ529_06485, partial [Cytophagaceae bacterium]|nr:hypothetical protein [Cytophagaceae bacterium]MDW8456426.1 hypothetical protein [Cytophagaceae bacterium]
MALYRNGHWQMTVEQFFVERFEFGRRPKGRRPNFGHLFFFVLLKGYTKKIQTDRSVLFAGNFEVSHSLIHLKKFERTCARDGSHGLQGQCGALAEHRS